ncbi:isopentenyl-diphosphate delta-isomerase [Salegentibacter holothuriorum]|uniref:Isopentenyl-diphosphate delta-isomerase n=1 Tax=Salegentibacter holothuriorum TaxID=241145 RepID=A0A1T5CNH5_9FLAO|nr:isopentenyl-diphosphate Delta-isomerase [Salegentibacter holothuriorum]SKB61058.1 isopentenyl-diphosphate delta-isomerase [Salegentibacter holothuriorum]
MGTDNVVLVNEKGEQIGLMEKIEAHEKALLHLAFSVFVFNEKNELMIQQRAHSKYHSPGLWTNTCCSHQREGESNVAAGKRRLHEEMGFSTELKEVMNFIYKAPFDNGLTEHEFDYILIGNYEDDPKPNPDEVANWKWMSLGEIKSDMEVNPGVYTEWFKIIFDKYYTSIQK